MRTIEITRDHYTDLEKLAMGVYSPVSGFMGEAEFWSVVDDFKLRSGEFFPLPIYFDVDSETADAVRHAIDQREGLTLRFEGKDVGLLRPTEVYQIEKADAALKIYGFVDRDHPGVDRFLDLKDFFVAGEVQLKERVSFDFSKYELTPQEAKAHFRKLGWETVVCFATRNVPHRGHEYLQRFGLELGDGLFIHITTPPKKKGIYKPEAIKRAYLTLIDDYYGRDRAILSFVSTTFRGAGPREALLQAVMKRNYGCTHFIIGRDHSGVKTYYGKYEAHQLSKRFDDVIGIKILRMCGPYFCNFCKAIVTEKTCRHHSESGAVKPLKSTFIRDDQAKVIPVDEDVMRTEIVESIKDMEFLYS